MEMKKFADHTLLFSMHSPISELNSSFKLSGSLKKMKFNILAANAKENFTSVPWFGLAGNSLAELDAKDRSVRFIGDFVLSSIGVALLSMVRNFFAKTSFIGAHRRKDVCYFC